jgi:hypothetical protein
MTIKVKSHNEITINKPQNQGIEMKIKKLNNTKYQKRKKKRKKGLLVKENKSKRKPHLSILPFTKTLN